MTRETEESQRMRSVLVKWEVRFFIGGPFMFGGGFFKFGFIAERSSAVNSEFGIRNCAGKKSSRKNTAAAQNILLLRSFLLIDDLLERRFRYPSFSIIPNSEFRIPNLGEAR